MYSESRVGKIYKRAVFGLPWWHRISTSYIDRTHLSLRLFNRRFTRLTLGYSRKLNYLQHSMALSVAHFNFCRVHASLKGRTPAMAAGLTDQVWSIAELLKRSGQVGGEKWSCPFHEVSASPSDSHAQNNTPSSSAPSPQNSFDPNQNLLVFKAQ